MTTRARSGWWTPVTTAIGVIVTLMALVGLGFGETDGPGIAAAIGWFTGGGVLLAGLALQRRRPLAGSWTVVGGAVLLALDPVAIPIAAVVFLGGLWSGSLVLTSEEASRIDLTSRQTDLTEGWYRWLGAAAALGAVGFLVLLIWPAVTPDNCTESNPCWQDSAAWATWILSWLTAMVTAGVGAVLGLLRLLLRHRTRLATS